MNKGKSQMMTERIKLWKSKLSIRQNAEVLGINFTTAQSMVLDYGLKHLYSGMRGRRPFGMIK